ncbi:hypothetical protein BDV06DRAFT_186295 [Aspergillus oleicola]
MEMNSEHLWFISCCLCVEEGLKERKARRMLQVCCCCCYLTEANSSPGRRDGHSEDRGTRRKELRRSVRIVKAGV